MPGTRSLRSVAYDSKKHQTKVFELLTAWAAVQGPVDIKNAFYSFTRMPQLTTIVESDDETLYAAFYADFQNTQFPHFLQLHAVASKEGWWRKADQLHFLKEYVQDAFNMGFHKVEIECSVASRLAVRLAILAGFKEEGTRRKRWVAHNGVYDIKLFGLFKEEWHNGQA